MSYNLIKLIKEMEMKLHEQQFVVDEIESLNLTLVNSKISTIVFDPDFDEYNKNGKICETKFYKTLIKISEKEHSVFDIESDSLINSDNYKQILSNQPFMICLLNQLFEINIKSNEEYEKIMKKTNFVLSLIKYILDKNGNIYPDDFKLFEITNSILKIMKEKNIINKKIKIVLEMFNVNVDKLKTEHKEFSYLKSLFLNIEKCNL